MTTTDPNPATTEPVTEPSVELVTVDDDRISIAKLARASGWDPARVSAGNLLITQHYVREISNLHQVKLEMLTVDVPPKGKYETQDLYTMQGKLAPTKHLLERVAMLAGVKWDVERSRFNFIDAETVVYTAVGGIRGPSGEMVWVPATKEWSLDVERADIEERAATHQVWVNGTKTPATDEQKAGYIRQEIARAKRHRIPMTESKARLRVLRSLLGIAGAADREYWSKPLFIPRVDIVLDASDPETRSRMLDEAFGARTLLGFPQPAAAPQLTAEPAEDVQDVEVVSEDEVAS